MNLSLPTASQLLIRFGARDLAEVAAPDNGPTIEPQLLIAAAAGEPLDDWSAADIAIALNTLARIADAISRARNEVSFYMRFRPAGAQMEPWVHDDLAEIARYHLYDDAGQEGSTVRVIYKDVIKRLETLAAEDEKRGASTAGKSGLLLDSARRLMSRKSLGGL